MKVEDLRKQSVKELWEQLAKDEANLAEFILDVRTKGIKDVKRGHRLKKEIARIKTIIQEKENSDG